jgi:hypothetical protein
MYLKHVYRNIYVYKTTQEITIIFEFYLKHQYRQEQEFQ